MALRPMVVLTALCIACIPGHAVAQDVTRIRPASANYRVHIWTRNRSLKAYEPDAEPDPL